MNRRQAAGFVAMAFVAAWALCTSCAGKREVVTTGTPDRSIAVYKARVTDAEGRSRSFKLNIIASLPDLFHAEVVAPVGGTRLIVDGGGGKIAVTIVADRTAFAGEASRKTMDQVFGIDISLRKLVRLLLIGEDPGTDLLFRREPEFSDGYPELLELESSGLGLRMELKRYRHVPDLDYATLCNGIPPTGIRVLPMTELDHMERPLLFPADGETE